MLILNDIFKKSVSCWRWADKLVTHALKTNYQWVWKRVCSSKTENYEDVMKTYWLSTFPWYISTSNKLQHPAICELGAVAMVTLPSRPWDVVLFQASYANVPFAKINVENKRATCRLLCTLWTETAAGSTLRANNTSADIIVMRLNGGYLTLGYLLLCQSVLFCTSLTPPPCLLL